MGSSLYTTGVIVYARMLYNNTKSVAMTNNQQCIDPQLTSDRLLYRLYHEDGATAYEPVPLDCVCHCSHERVASMLKGFNPEELAETIQDGKITVNCEFCSEAYEFDPADFERMPIRRAFAAIGESMD